MCFKIIDDTRLIDKHQWSDFVKNNPNGNIFQSPEMFDVYLETDLYEPVAIFAINNANKIIGTLQSVIQREYKGVIGLLTSRSIIWGGPIIDNENAEIANLLIERYNKIVKRNVIYSQFRNFFNTSEHKNIFLKFNYIYEDHLNIIIDLNKSTEQIFNSFTQDRRWEIRKAYKKGVIIEDVQSDDKLPIFYSFIKMVYDRIKIPCPDICLIKNVYNMLIKNGYGKFYLIKFENQYIGSHSVFLYKDQVTCWYGGLDRKYQKYFPYEALIWESMKWGAENGYKTFDFQGAGKPDKEYSVRDFKKRFGGEIINFGRYENIHKPIFYKIGKLGLKIWKLVK